MSRHKSLANAMSTLLAYKNRPEGEPVPMQTNWTVVVTNDNAEPEVAVEMRIEARVRIRPTVERIMEQVNGGDVERNDAGQIIRIGNLRFSDGSQVEGGYRYGPGGEVVATKIRLPVGAMLGASEKMERVLGGDDNPVEVTASNNYFADMFKVKRTRRASSGKVRRGTNYTHEQAKGMLAEAYANTPMYAVTKCPPGLPSAGGKVADSFLGMKKAASGESGSVGWQDIAAAIVDREIWAQAIAKLSGRDRETLDRVANGRVRTLAEISPGGHKRTAERRGKRTLMAANENFSRILKKVAS